MSFETDVRIDVDALDVEWTRQPELVLKYGKMLAEARARSDQLKEALELAEAEVKSAIRVNPEKFGIEKVTEGAINEALLQSEKYQDALKSYQEARSEQDMLQAGMNAINAKKDALENMVRLLGQNYFAAPTVPRNISEEVRKRIDAAKSVVAESRIKDALKPRRSR